jgi:hypothetical protein
MRWVLWFFLGFALGYAFYANLMYAPWRAVFVIAPLLIGLALLLFLRKTAEKA